jgi:hypothetical protein
MKNNAVKILLALYFVANSLSAKAADTDETFVTYCHDGNGNKKGYCCEKYEKGLEREIDRDLANHINERSIIIGDTPIENMQNKPLVLQMHNMRNFDGLSEKKYMKAAERLIWALNDKAENSFKTRLNSLELTETVIKDKNYTTEQIFDLLMSGVDSFNTEKDHDIDIDVTLYYARWSKVIGYTNAGSWRTWVNKKYLDIMTPNELAGHILHEYLHNVGFTHYEEHSTSVPYQLGELLIKVLNESKEFEPSQDEIASPQREGCLIS